MTSKKAILADFRHKTYERQEAQYRITVVKMEEVLNYINELIELPSTSIRRNKLGQAEVIINGFALHIYHDLFNNLCASMHNQATLLMNSRWEVFQMSKEDAESIALRFVDFIAA